jgi:hypothetical protein
MSWYCCWEANVKIMYFTVCVLPATGTRFGAIFTDVGANAPDRTPPGLLAVKTELAD